MLVLKKIKQNKGVFFSFANVRAPMSCCLLSEVLLMIEGVTLPSTMDIRALHAIYEASAIAGRATVTIRTGCPVCNYWYPPVSGGLPVVDG